MNKDIFKNIIESYNSLWKLKDHGNTIEVITPTSTTNDMFISIFITQRGDEYVVTDGGWLNDEIYGVKIEYNFDCFNRLYAYYYNFYDIKETDTGKKCYYKKTKELKLIPNLVYDVSNFVAIIVSSSLIGFQDIKEEVGVRIFRKQANDFLSGITSKDKIKFASHIDEKYKYIKFNAVIEKKNRLTLINYITGSNESNFILSIGKTNMNFEVIDNSSHVNFVDRKVAIINDFALGYKTDKLVPYFNLIKKNNIESVKWSSKNEIEKYI
ncbi:MAG: hypothetical protein LBO74_09315 [Candidatus Symbiothrix sp.]|jgi:hypothetical protein|nr:hypothetical protein [Candidatus Symbiothrix sp.]